MKSPEPHIGEPAPLFAAETQDGAKISLEKLAGQFVVLYFYPKDDTPGCTIEACAFRDAYADFTGQNVVILGVSADSAEAHRKFVKNRSLPFPLLVDADKRIVRAYGVYGWQTFMGIPYRGVARKTFLIDPQGRIAKIWPNVKPSGHAAEVMDAIAELRKEAH